MRNAVLVCSSAVLAVLGCTRRAADTSQRSVSNNDQSASIVLVAASDSGISVAVYEERGKLIENGDYFCAARPDGLGGVYGSIRTGNEMRCFRAKDALLTVSENGQRLSCTRAENTHEGFVTHCNVWESFNRRGFIDARLEGFRDGTCRAVFKGKPHTNPMHCNVLLYMPGEIVVASYSCYPTLDALKKYGRPPSETIKRVEVECTPVQPYTPDRIYTDANCKAKFTP